MPAPHALILGATGGIGAAVVAELAGRGFGLSLIAREDGPLAALAVRTGGLSLLADATDPDALRQAVARARAKHGPIALVAACAGRVTPGRFEDLSEADHLDEMALNHHAVRRLLSLTLPEMRARGAGRALVIGSAASLWGLPGYAAYGPSKFALKGLVETLQAEYRGTGVTLTLCQPTDTDTAQLAAERPRRPPELAAIAGVGGVMAPETVARRAVAACLKGRAVSYPDVATFLLARFGPAVAPALRWWFGRIAGRAYRP